MSQNWTVANIPDVTGKVICITGANSGIGYESAKELANKGAEVIMACRNMAKASVAKQELIQEIPHAKVEVMELNLSSLASVRAFVTEFLSRYQRLDVLLNNAGIMMTPYGQTEDGFEQQIGVNHLGHFALTGLLLPLILKTPQARVVNVSSNAHKMGKIHFQNVMFEGGKGYTPLKAYNQSKFANLLFTYELQRLFEQHGVDAKSLAAHPGASDTNLMIHIKKNVLFRAFKPIVYLFVQDAAMGALPNIRASVDPDVKGDEYFGPKGFQELQGYPVVVKSTKASHNQEHAAKLWSLSEELTGVTYSW